MIPTLLLDAVRMVAPCSAMAEVLGHKSLLGLGVVVVWLLLFHLLVNIWLLCMFTSLLVVLGGWLGSQAVLESNSVIHLERFMTLEKVSSSVEDEQYLDQEIHNTVRKIIRDFVSSWYSKVSSDSHFETEVHEAMVSMAMELKLRARQVDRKELTERILDLFGSHLQDYIKSKELVKEQRISPTAGPKSEREQLLETYFNIASPHLAMTSASEEINYVRAMVDLLLHILVPTPHLKSRTGRFVVGELITCNVMQPLIDKVSNPDWVNILIVDIFGKSNKPQRMDATEPLTVSPPQAPTSPVQASLPALINVSQSSVVTQQPAEAEVISVNKMPISEPAAKDAVDAEEVDFPTNNEEDESAQPFLRRFTGGRKSNPFYQEYDSDLDSPQAEEKQQSMDSLVIIDQEEIPDDKKKQCRISLESNIGVDFGDVNASSVDGSCPKVIVNSETVVPPNACGSTSVSSADVASVNSTLQDVEREGGLSTLNTNRELVLGGDQTVMGNPNELTVISPIHTCSPMGTFSFEPLSSPEGPVIIQNLRITGTITAKEHRGTGSHPYTLYTIKYETAMGFESQGSSHSSSEDAEAGSTCCENTSSIHPVAYHMVNRRYSEFLNLQTRLEEKGDLRKLIKGVKGPKKVFPEMPFGNMDSDKIEARKGLLETFLKQLCTMPEIANSVEMQEFLALNTDARIAFVKKPFIASRIDKFVVNAIVDTLKTAFPRSEPQSPTEDEVEVDGGKLSLDKKSRSRLRFSSKNISFMNGADIRPPVLFSLDQTNMVFKGASLEVLEAFISEQENLSLAAEADSECSTSRRVISSRNKREKCNNEHVASGSETALAEVVLNILCLLMNEQWTWLCTENIQKTIRLLFGTLINRWLDVRVANLTSARYWAIYLQVVQEAVWPGGSLPKHHHLERSQQQRDITKQRALHCLMSLLPDLVSDMLGSEKYKISWQIVLDSFQDKRINRHFVYCMFDLLLEVLVPEIPEEAFQRSMLQTLSKNPEKLLA